MATLLFIIVMFIGYSSVIEVVNSTTSECSSERKNSYASCASVLSNSSCTNYETYFKYTEDVDLLQLEFKAMNYIEENVSNQYCRNYLKAALCVTIYPPCNNVSNNASIQRLCPGECDSLLNSSTCSSDTTNVVEFLSSQIADPIINFTINCSNSLSFANMFLNTSTCYDNNCISILDSAEVPNTCLQLNFLRQTICADYTFATDFYGYGYTSNENLTALAAIIESLKDFFEFSFLCHRFAAYFICNYVFVPCDLFTGAPRSICTDSCNYLRRFCDDTYFTVVNVGSLTFPIVDNCENTLIQLQTGYNFPCSSSSLGNDCIDLLSIFGLEDFAITRTSDITQSTCQVNFETINNQPSINIQLLTTPTNTITMNTAVSSTTDSAPIATNMITMNTTFSSATDSAPIAIAVASVVGGILGLCIIFICIVGLIIKNKKRQGSIKRGIFTIESLTSLFNRKSHELQNMRNKGNDNTLMSNIYTHISLTNLRRECGDLDELLISAKDIEFNELLGEGEFGCVYKGIWTQTTAEKESISDVVAVKTIKNNNDLKSFVNECILMKKLDHLNVLPVLGICLESNHESGLPFMVLPFMYNGDLKSYLKKKRIKPACVDQLPEDLNQNDLLDMCYHIACGMNYLSSKRFVHRDLAARNCMVDKYLHIKVADFGLARDVYMTDYYRQKTIGKLPAKWMAPEALHDRISNEKTDVWSYGITCWEVFNLGRTPYPTIPNHEILKYIDDGNRPSKPNLCPDAMYALMLKCWEADVDERLCFKEIVEMLGEVSGNKTVV